MDNKEKVDDIEYTIVMDDNFSELTGPDADGAELKDYGEDAIAAARKRTVDGLYAEYEKMCLKDPTILDTDDAYPHTYQWRIGDKYDTAKVEVVAAALKQGKRITDTEEYERYAEEVSSMNFKPRSWD